MPLTWKIEGILENIRHSAYLAGVCSINYTCFEGKIAMHIISIQGMSCQHCVASVTKALQDIPGVSKVSVDLSKGQASYVGDISPTVVKEAINAIGFTVLDVK